MNMDDRGREMMASALLRDNAVMINAVASLLARQQQGSKEDSVSLTSPMLVLTSVPGKESLQANVVLGSTHSSNLSKGGMGLETGRESLAPTLEEQVHALATANLLASTQRDIAEQLAQAGTSSDTESPPKFVSRRTKKQSSSSKKSAVTKKVNTKKCGPKGRPDALNMAVLDCKPVAPVEPKAMICSFEGCNRKFAWLTHLKYHELTHTNNRQFKCPVELCGKMFFTAQRLNVHLRTHTGERPFKCKHENCGKTFTTAGNLKNHERIHTGEQPYVCDFSDCNRRFTESSSLRKHKLTHSGDKPFECKICGKKYTQSGSRQQHLQRHHLDDEIRQSLKQAASKKESEGPSGADVLKRVKTESLEKKSGSIEAVSCSPQVLVLNNTYHELPTSESIVFSHGLNDRVVTVTTQSVEQHISSESLSLSHELLNSDGLTDDGLQGKSDDLVVLSETPIYHHDDNAGDIVYTTDILDHEEVAHADYVTSHVDYSSEISNSTYSHHGEINTAEDFTQQHMSTAENFDAGHGEMTISGYGTSETIQHSSVYTHSKEVPNTYLDTEGDIGHSDFIGAEEVTVAHYSGIANSSCLGDGSALLETARIKVKSEDCSESGDHDSHSALGSFNSSSVRSDSVGVADVGSPSHTHSPLSSGQVTQEIHMDPMMECDEDPVKKEHLSPTLEFVV